MSKFLKISIIILVVIMVGFVVSYFYRTPKEGKKPEEIVTQREEIVMPEEIVTQREEIVKPEEIVTQREEIVMPEEIVTQREEIVMPEERFVTIAELLKKGYGVKSEGLGGPGMEIPTNYFISPSLINGKVIALNETHSIMYLIENQKLSSLISVPNNHLTNYVLSPGQNLIGFKLIETPPLQGQSPAVYRLSSRELIRLRKPIPSTAGGVTFSKDKVAFTVDERLIIVRYDEDKNIYLMEEEIFDLGAVLDLGGFGLPTFTPISPDSQLVIGRDVNDQLWIINFRTGEKFQFTDGKLGYFNPIWSPDGKKIAYQGLNGWLRVYDFNNKTTYSFGDLQTGKPSWSPDSEYIIFDLKQVVETARFINSDLFIAKFDGSQIIQLTDTEDRFEMDSIFSKDGEEIVFSNYVSGGEIYVGKFENFELKGIEKLYPGE